MMLQEALVMRDLLRKSRKRQNVTAI